MKYRIRHTPTDSWIWYEQYANGFHCSIATERNGLKPTEWETIEPRVLGLIKTAFGHSNVEVVEAER